MSESEPFLTAAEAARRLGVSVKALRLYERRGLVVPLRTAAGWRAYGPGQMARAAEVAALRSLGLGLAEVSRALAGGTAALDAVLAAHQAALDDRGRQIADQAGRVRALRAGLRPVAPRAGTVVAFDLPWPWGGERFELRDVRPITFIIGPLGSGKTRLARKIADTLPDAAFLGLDRCDEAAMAGVGDRLRRDAALRTRVARRLGDLVAGGAVASDALTALLAALESAAPRVLVVDMVEQGLDEATQRALVADLRRRASGGRTLFLMTRSSAVLDLAAVGPDEAIILCPANHSPPVRVLPAPGSPGYEAVATCIAPPHVRARTEGTVAWRPRVA